MLDDTRSGVVLPSSDSTGSGVYGIDSRHMKRAALYAPVSGDLQAKEGTIESQVLVLKKQIAAAGHVLVKEYLDNGFSGPRFDRPALNEMRKDVKTDLFDVIYFHDADRIAREVTIQTIIIEEILKHRKQLIINGKDYVKNPENKFTLTVLGAVAELERAKIIERVTRGKQLRLEQGQLLGCGVHTFGYDYIRKSPNSRPQMIISVRYVFETYANEQIGLDRIARRLEDMGLTKTAKNLWRRSFLKTMLGNETYLGVKYFNTMRCIREYANPIYDIKHSTLKRINRSREDWIGVEVPAIISRELFDRVQARRAVTKSDTGTRGKSSSFQPSSDAGVAAAACTPIGGGRGASEKGRPACSIEWPTNATGDFGSSCIPKTQRSTNVPVGRSRALFWRGGCSQW
jgi:DNA invertase Pin-like site-specific DNA recombinase